MEEDVAEVVDLVNVEETEDQVPELEPVLDRLPLVRNNPVFSRPVNPIIVSKRWKEYLDPATDRLYYFDRVTKGVQWRKPAGFLNRKELLRPVSANRIGTSDWKVISTLGGRDYFYNISTGTTAWKLPEDFNTPIPVKASETEASSSSANDKKRVAQDDIDAAAPEKKRRMLASDSSKPASLLGKFEDTRETSLSNYKNMLISFKVDQNALWSDWQSKLAQDGRFHEIASPVERRSLFESYVRQLASEAKKSKKRELELAKEALWAEIEKSSEKSWRGFDAFKDHFRPTEAYQHLRDIHPDSIGDIYDEMKQKEAEKQKKLRERAKRDFTAMLEERIRDRYERDTRKDWLDFKLELESDPRYNRAQLSGSDRENLFEDFAAEVRRSIAPKSRESHHDRREQRYDDDRNGHERHSESNKREEALRKRYDEAQRQRGREADQAREKHERVREDREIANFKILLSERVLKSNVSWEDVEPMLSRDPRFETTYLGKKYKIRLFEDHIEDLKRAAEKSFWRLLNVTGSSDFYQTWQEASNELIGTAAFTLLTTNSEREESYNRWAKEEKKRAENNLNQLFRDTKSITADTDLENTKTTVPLLDELRKDVRWRVLPDSSVGWSARRMQLLEEYIASKNESKEQ